MKHRALPLALLVLLAACGAKPELPPPAQRIVKAMTVDDGSTERVRSFGGDIRARHETLAGFRVAGKIAERLVEVGAAVKPGQPLARLDAADMALRVGEAEAHLSLAEADAKRYRNLLAKNFVSQSAVDTHDAAQKTASAQAALARNQTEYATLRADHAGVVAEVLAQPGQVVAAGQSVLRLAWDGEREVAIALPEDALADIRVGSEAAVSLWATPGKTYRGRVRELAPIADPATRTYAARVSLVGAAAAPLGMSATVSFKLPHVSSLLVPMTSILQQGNQPAVWVIAKDDKLSLRPVRVSSYGDDGARIANGLAPGERIVTAGVNRLRAGEPVRIAEETR